MADLAADLAPAARAMPSAAADHYWVSPAQLLATLRLRWPVVALCGVLAGGGAYAYTKQLPQLYSSAGTLALELRSVNIPVLQGALSGESLGDPMPLVRTEVQELQARALVQEVVDELHLTRLPEFNAALRPPAAMIQAKHWLATHLPPGASAPLVSAGILPDLSRPVVPPTADVIEANVVGDVMHKLSVITDDRSLIITVQFLAQNPAVAADIVNAVIKHYMQNKSAAHDTANVQANAALTRQITQVRAEMAGLEQRINDTRIKYNLTQTSAGSVGQQQLQDLSSALTRASADRAQAEADASRAAALAQAGEIAQDSAEVLNSSTVSALRGREAEMAQRVAELETTLGPNNPRLRAAQAQLASARAALGAQAHRVVVSLGAQAEAARAREANLRQQLSAAETSAGAVAGVQSELQQLQKDADARRAVYQTLLQGEAQTEAAGAKDAPPQTGARLVSAAVPPLYPAAPNVKMASLLGLLGGCAFGGLLALAGGRREEGFAKAEEVTAETGLATLAVLPRLSGRHDSLASRVVAEPTGVEAEMLRSLRMRLRFAGRGAAPRSVLFVSSLAGEGSSSMAAAFARVAALDGLRVLLIEGDLQKPSLSRVLGVTPSNGLVAALQGSEDWRDQVLRDPRTPLEMLLVAGGQPGSNQLLEAIQMQNLMADAREDYNVVVMDGQPVTRATRSMVLAQLADAVVLVIEALATPRATVRDAVGAMASATRQNPVAALNKAA